MYNQVSTAPFTDFTKSTSLKTFAFWLGLLPQIALLFATGSWNSLLVIACAIMGTALSQIDSFVKKENIRMAVSYSLLTGTLVGFFLPPEYPLASVFLITFVMMFATKSVFGPPGVSWLNPVAITVVAAWFVGRMAFGSFLISGADLAAKNPSLALIDGALLQNGVDEAITLFLNDNVFSLFNVSIPNGYVSLFWDNHAAIPAFRFTFFTILASVFYFAFDFKKAEIPLTFVFLYLALVKFASPLLTGAAPMGGDVLLAMLSSGVLFTAVFLLQWPGTVPYTILGKCAFILFCSAFAFLFCGAGTSPIGAVMTVLFANIVSPALQVIENKNIKKRLSSLLNEKLGEAQK
ncbi:MAG: RnfABCDGE type electron transport complex subunit D [Treponema sp.]|nr:RnfABCDGE type electron transport complex subunit D [Treponema sp.]